jgi:hypothetical protein
MRGDVVGHDKHRHQVPAWRKLVMLQREQSAVVGAKYSKSRWAKAVIVVTVPLNRNPNRYRLWRVEDASPLGKWWACKLAFWNLSNHGWCC